MDRASRLDAAELLHDAFYRRSVWTSTSELGIRHRAMLLRGQRRVDGVEPPRPRADAVIRLPHGSRRHLAQLVDVRVAQIVDVRLRSRDHDLLLARVLTDPRDTLTTL